MQDPSNLRRIDLENTIHPTAIVHPWAKIGVGVRIGPYSIIGEHVELGDGCVLGPNVVIEGRTTIGKNNRFFHGATIGTAPQDIKFQGAVTYLETGDDCIFREFVTVNVATGQGEKTLIGSNCFLMAYVHVAHNCRLGDHVVLANSVNLAGYVDIGDHAVVGGATNVHQFVRIGIHAFIGGMSRIQKDIPPFVRAAGHPLRIYGVNSIGLERRGFAREKRTMIKEMFNLLYRTHLNVSQVLEKLRNGRFEDPERGILVDFLETSERGINK